jgi:hypothetical protein
VSNTRTIPPEEQELWLATSETVTRRRHSTQTTSTDVYSTPKAQTTRPDPIQSEPRTNLCTEVLQYISPGGSRYNQKNSDSDNSPRSETADPPSDPPTYSDVARLPGNIQQSSSAESSEPPSHRTRNQSDMGIPCPGKLKRAQTKKHKEKNGKRRNRKSKKTRAQSDFR